MLPLQSTRCRQCNRDFFSSEDSFVDYNRHVCECRTHTWTVRSHRTTELCILMSNLLIETITVIILWKIIDGFRSLSCIYSLCTAHSSVCLLMTGHWVTFIWVRGGRGSETGLRFNMALMSFSCVQKCEFLQLSHKSRQTQPSSHALQFFSFLSLFPAVGC